MWLLVVSSCLTANSRESEYKMWTSLLERYNEILSVSDHCDAYFLGCCCVDIFFLLNTFISTSYLLFTLIKFGLWKQGGIVWCDCLYSIPPLEMSLFLSFCSFHCFSDFWEHVKRLMMAILPSVRWYLIVVPYVPLAEHVKRFSFKNSVRGPVDFIGSPDWPQEILMWFITKIRKKCWIKGTILFLIFLR